MEKFVGDIGEKMFVVNVKIIKKKLFLCILNNYYLC